MYHYNPFLVYCRELAPGTVSLTGDRAQGDDSKYDSNYSGLQILVTLCNDICNGFSYNYMATSIKA